MPDKRKAAPDWHQEAAQEDQLAARIIPPLGNCINCGQHIRLTAGVTTCPTCAAWRRWYSAHRIASRYLREVQR